MVTNIVLLDPRNRENIATVLRSGQNMNVSSVSIIGGVIKEKYNGVIHKFKHQMDTQNGCFDIPLFYYNDLDDYLNHLPAKTTLVIVEITDYSKSIIDFQHPKNATYLFGPEVSGIKGDEIEKIKQYVESLQKGIPLKFLEGNENTVHLDFLKIPTPDSLNLGVCASIIMYDRHFIVNDNYSKSKLG